MLLGASLSRVLVDNVALPNFEPSSFDGVTPLTIDLLGFDFGVSFRALFVK